MPVPPPLLDLATLDLDRTEDDREGIARFIQHRRAMLLIDRIVHYDPDGLTVAGVRDVRADEFWCDGHFPGAPLLPGVLQVEAAAQVCAYHCNRKQEKPMRLLVFAGLSEVKFRSGVRPGDRLVIVEHERRLREHSVIMEFQAYVRGTLVVDGVIQGMSLEGKEKERGS